MIAQLRADKSVCIIGLGYVGLTLAVAMAEAGLTVHGVEREAAIVDQISHGAPHFLDAGLESRLKDQITTGRFKASVDWPDPAAVSVYVVTVGTPLDANGQASLDAITKVLERISAQLKDGDLVILRSTVSVGVSTRTAAPLLRNAGVDFHLAFCPERTVEGRALEELQYLPQIVGGLTEEAAARAEQLFARITPTVIRVSDLATAEMVKLLNNTHRDLMFAFANEVALACEDMGVSAAEVIRASSLDYQRATMSMAMPGLVGGSCLETSPYILAESTSSPSEIAPLAILGRAINEALPAKAVSRMTVIRASQSTQRIAILGLAFKGRPETSDLRGTLAVKLIASLRDGFPGAEIGGFDPCVSQSDAETLGIIALDGIAAAFNNADLVIFQNNNPRFARLDLSSLSAQMQHDGLIYDFWNQFDVTALRLAKQVSYCALGSSKIVSA